MQKNVASQKWIVFAFGRTSNTPKTGDAANITADLRLDGGTANPISGNPTELEGGYYYFTPTQAQTNADMIVICPVSSTPDVIVIGVPGAVWTEPAGLKYPATLAYTDVTGNLPAQVKAQDDIDFGATQKATIDARLEAFDPPTKGELDAAQLVVTNAISALHNATQGATAAELAAAELVVTNAISALHNLSTGDIDSRLEAFDPPTRAEATADKAEILASMATRATLGSGGIAWTYTLTRSDNGLPIADANVWVTTDLAGYNIIAAGRTDQNGVVIFALEAGTIYVWRQKSGFEFVNPDTEVVSS